MLARGTPKCSGTVWVEGEAMKKFAAVIEEGPNNYSAYVPDLPGCVSTGKTLAEIEKNIREAIEYHIEGMIEDGDPVPEPTSRVIEVELPVA
jgi:predicted RNase H-like HicB family nuclease